MKGLLLGILNALEILECMHRVLLCMLEAVKGKLCLLDVLEMLEVMHGVLFGPLEQCLWDVSSVCWRC